VVIRKARLDAKSVNGKPGRGRRNINLVLGFLGGRIENVAARGGLLNCIAVVGKEA
jgi:hypothetical protein